MTDALPVPQTPDQLVPSSFEQEINEVYLLLDYISGRPDKHLYDLNSKLKKDESSFYSADEIIGRVAKLRNLTVDIADDDAAFVLLVKDLLSSISYPARGLSIAYTTMFAEESRATQTSRAAAARKAFPGLEGSARGFRRLKTILAWSGLLVTCFSAIFLWQVAYGVQLASRFDAAKKDDTLATVRLFDQVDKDSAHNIKENMNIDKLCLLKAGSESTLDTDKVNGSNEDQRSSAVRGLCNDYAYKHALFCVAIDDLAKYAASAIFRAYAFLLPNHDLQDRDASSLCGGKKGRQEDAASIAGVLETMSNYLLPILFGLVGTMAALVRSIQDKVTDSVLSPRDKSLSLIRLPLGVVAGVSVGLFLGPNYINSHSGQSIGLFTVSASGIAFLAGYGADSFFRALDGLIGRVFVLEDAKGTRK